MNIFGNPTESGGFKNPANTVLDMNDYKIINLDTPIDNKDGVNKVYVDTAISSGLPPGNSYSDYIYWDNNTSTYKSGNVKVHIGTDSGVINQADYTVAIGYNSGNVNQSGNAVSIGNGSGNQNQGPGALAIGALSGLQNQGVYATAIGYQAGFQNQSNNSVAIGINSGYQNQGTNCVAIGSLSGNQYQGDFAISLGFQSGEINQPPYSVCIGQNTNCTLPHEVVLGDSSCPQVKSHGYFVSDQGVKLSSGGSSTQYFTTDGGVGSPSSSGSSNIYLYNSNTNTNLLTITSGQIRYNNSVQPNSNQICISHLTRDNIDIDPFLTLVAINNIIYIQDQSTSANYIKYKVIASPSISPNNYYIFTVSVLDSQGTGSTNFANGHDIFMSIYTDTQTIDARLNLLDSDVLALQNGKLSIDGSSMMTGSLDMQNNSIEYVSYLSFQGTCNVGFLNINNFDMAQNVLCGQGNTNNGEDQILLGTGNTSTSSSYTLGVGYVNNVDSNFGIAVGFNNTHSDSQQSQICIGYNNTTSGEGCMAFGRDITNGTKNSLCIGTSNMEWIFPNSSSCALGNPSIHPFKELYIDGGVVKTGGTANDLYCADGSIDSVTINNASSALSIANNSVQKSGDTMTGNLVIQHDLYQSSRMIQGCIYTTSNQSTLSAYGTLLASHLTNVGTPTPLAVGQTNANTLNKIIKIICQPTSVAAYQDSGFLGNNTFYRNQAGLYVGMGFSYNITFGIGDTNISGGVYSVGMQVGLVASPTTPLWSASITPDNTASWFGVGHNYSDSVLSFYNKGIGGAGTKTATPYVMSTPSTLYFSLTMINQFASNDVLLVLKELISNTSITQTYTMSGINSVSNTTRLYPVFTRIMGATASSGSAQISFSSMSLTA